MGKIVQTAGRNTLGEFAPEFAHFNDDVLFGENWNNQDIDVKTRSIITVVALMASGIDVYKRQGNVCILLYRQLSDSGSHVDGQYCQRYYDDSGNHWNRRNRDF